MPKYKYKFSIIVPIYNVEDYVRETIESVINQSIGFEDNIQMILVNDGSLDNSEAICLEYQKKYPDNIIYLKQKNAGVSAARNKGLKYAEGEYINFLDSDDLWDPYAFKYILNFFLNNPKVDIVVGRMRFFEASNKFHMLDYKFDDGTRLININKEPKMIHLHITSAFIKRSTAQKYAFDTKLKYGEDAKYLSEIIIDRRQYGLVKEALHFYRKRQNHSSAIQNKDNNADWYTLTVDRYYNYIFKYSQDRYHKIIKYAQYLVMYDYQFRLKHLIPDILTDRQKKHYLNATTKLLRQIDDEVIINQRFMFADYKYYALSLKYEDEFASKNKLVENFAFFNGMYIYNISNRNVLSINILKVKDDNLVIYGELNSLLNPEDYHLLLEIDESVEVVELLESNKNVRYGLDRELYHNRIFKISIPLKKAMNIGFYIQYKDSDKYLLKPNFKIKAKLDVYYKTYWTYQQYLFKCRKDKIIVVSNNMIKRIFMSLVLILQMFTHFKWKELIYRLLYYMAKIFKTKEIWLISDRTMVANDNGMHLFNYINSLNSNEQKVYFVLNKNSTDFNSMKKHGLVVAHNSLKYKILFLLADKIISSQADIWVYNAFGKRSRFYRDLYNYKFVFLQHGITKDDISDWLNIYNKDIDLFITAAKAEYDSIINGNYGYDESIVKLTGFARYDNLYDEAKNIIAVMPTWRQELSGKIDRAAGIREYNPDFNKSEYFTFYNNLINDERLLSAMRKYHFKGIFVVHPSHIANSKDFQGNDIFTTIEDFADYQKIFREAKLLISDYSSVPFDFAFMHKPVIYTQFDKANFFKTHLYNEGYFDYNENGFGPVEITYEQTVETIIKYLENGCKLEAKYEKRINDFYQFHDRFNCRRIYDEIKKL